VLTTGVTSNVNDDTIYLLGFTKALDLPTDNLPFGESDCFVMILDSSGLLLSNYVGGSSTDICIGRPVLFENQVYIRGRTLSDFTVIQSAFSLESPRCFVAILNAADLNLLKILYIDDNNEEKICSQFTFDEDEDEDSWIHLVPS